MKPTLIKTALLALGVCVAADAAWADEPANSMSPTAAPLTPQQFSWEASVANLKEIHLGQVAEQNSTNAEVKEFAERMVKDHSKANRKLATIAAAESLDLPDTNVFNVAIDEEASKQATQLMQETPQEQLDQERIAAQRLAALSGPGFEEAYASAMVMDHTNAIQLFECASTNLMDKKLQRFAKKTLPTLREHYEMAQKLQAELNGTQPTNSTMNTPSTMPPMGY